MWVLLTRKKVYTILLVLQELSLIKFFKESFLFQVYDKNVLLKNCLYAECP